MVDINQLTRKASQQFQKGRMKDANKSCQKILKQAPKFIDAINMYGITFAELGELNSAAEQFSKIIKLEPNKLAAYENLGRVYIQMQQYSKAQTLYEQGIKLEPRSYNMHFGLASALMSQNSFQSALASFNTAKAIEATNPSLFINMGTVLSHLGKSKEALESLRHALKLNAKSAEAYLRLGQLYIQHNDFLQAEDVLFKASQIQKNNFNIQLSLADAYQHNSKPELAIKHYLIADKLQPKSQNVYTKLDKLILYSGNKDKKVILDRLSQQHVYESWAEAVDDAKRLVELTEYYDDSAMASLYKFMDAYEPGKLHPREWWQQQLKQYGDARFGHDKILRAIHSAVFSWSLPDKQTLSSIAEFVQGTRLYSYGAGSALWERLLSEHFNIDVKATDFKPRHSYLPITAEDYSQSTIPEGDTIFLAWIVRGDTGILNILKQCKSAQKLVLIGEPPDNHGVPRICATPEMFALLKENFTLSQTIPLVSYSMLNDTVSLYVKN